VIASVGLLVVCWVVMHFVFKFLLIKRNSKRKHPREQVKFSRKLLTSKLNETDRKRLFKYVFWFSLSVFLSQTAMLLTYLLSDKPTGSDFWIVSSICTPCVLLSNHVVCMLWAHHPRQAVIASVVAALLLLATANHFSSLPAGIMSFYGLGYGQKYSVFVNAEGQALKSKLGLSETCAETSSSPDRICGAEILSALGNDYYLQVGEKRFTLPKSMVVARTSE
jgi:hypothetical protein